MIEIESFYQTIIEDMSDWESETYTLDFINVEIISLCAIQMLLSLKKFCDESNIQLICTNINSNNIIQTLKTYHLLETLGVTDE
jgi:anti-anti-sigma regulatory factor